MLPLNLRSRSRIGVVYLFLLITLVGFSCRYLAADDSLGVFRENTVEQETETPPLPFPVAKSPPSPADLVPSVPPAGEHASSRLDDGSDRGKWEDAADVGIVTDPEVGRKTNKTEQHISDGVLVATRIMQTIVNPKQSDQERLACPKYNTSRYEYLRKVDDAQPKYFFAVDLTESMHVLPQILGAIFEAIQYLGPSNCVLSVIEGGFNDGTFEVLSMLKPILDEAGIEYFLDTSNLKPQRKKPQNASLAELLNLVLLPLTTSPDDYSRDTTIIFLNSVSLCYDDILELIHQRIFQKADMTCAMDWEENPHAPAGGNPLSFYDFWIARTMTGDSFFDIPDDGDWDLPRDLFTSDETTLSHYQAHRPFQVFSCWNGITAIAAEPFLDATVQFRNEEKATETEVEECFQGQARLLAKDLWRLGYGKIAVVPSVNMGYSNDATRKVKALEGFTSEWVQKEEEMTSNESNIIEWQEEPPALVRCIYHWSKQFWVPWNQGFEVQDDD